MANYKLTEQAREDHIRIHQCGMARFGEKQADKYFELLFKSFDLIASNSYTFESVDHLLPGYRRCVCGAESIFYKLNNGLVVIVAIIGKQDLHALFR